MDVATKQVFERYRWAALAMVYLLCAFDAWLPPLPAASLSRILDALLYGAVLAFWCGLDAKLRGRRYLRTYELATVFTWPGAMLIYLVWTRRLRGVGWYLLNALGMMLTFMLASRL